MKIHVPDSLPPLTLRYLKAASEFETLRALKVTDLYLIGSHRDGTAVRGSDVDLIAVTPSLLPWALEASRASLIHTEDQVLRRANREFAKLGVLDLAFLPKALLRKNSAHPLQPFRPALDALQVLGVAKGKPTHVSERRMISFFESLDRIFDGARDFSTQPKQATRRNALSALIDLHGFVCGHSAASMPTKAALARKIENEEMWLSPQWKTLFDELQTNRLNDAEIRSRFSRELNRSLPVIEEGLREILRGRKKRVFSVGSLAFDPDLLPRFLEKHGRRPLPAKVTKSRVEFADAWQRIVIYSLRSLALRSPLSKRKRWTSLIELIEPLSYGFTYLSPESTLESRWLAPGGKELVPAFVSKAPSAVLEMANSHAMRELGGSGAVGRWVSTDDRDATVHEWTDGVLHLVLPATARVSRDLIRVRSYRILTPDEDRAQFIDARLASMKDLKRVEIVSHLAGSLSQVTAVLKRVSRISRTRSVRDLLVIAPNPAFRPQPALLRTKPLTDVNQSQLREALANCLPDFKIIARRELGGCDEGGECVTMGLHLRRS